MSFRGDLNVEQQMLAIREYRDQRRHRVAMKEWMTTRASRESHRIMLHMLVNEAQRHTGTSPQGTTVGAVGKSSSSASLSDSFSTPPMGPAHDFTELHFHIENLMQEQDNYGLALQEIGRMGLFTARGSLPCSASSSTTNSPMKPAADARRNSN